MRRAFLSEYFAGVVAKTLSAVEAAPRSSNQHEFNGTKPLQALLGHPGGAPTQYRCRFIFVDDEAPPITADGLVTWYDSRERHPVRSEPRLYYRSNVATERMAPGDLLIIGRHQNGSLLAIVAKAGSSADAQMQWLFGLGTPTASFKFIPEAALDKSDLELAARTVLEAIGLEVATSDEGALERMLKLFDGTFPTTREFSAFARQQVLEIELTPTSSDQVLLNWLDREEVLFRTLEKHLVGERLRQGFSGVDDFMAYSLSVQNRRKARAGSALENHLEALFTRLGIRHTRGGVTEQTSRPDFVFPGLKDYHDGSFAAAKLTMLAAKSTCKDRWRQILREAERIPTKHLLTLEPAISENQTAEMFSALVVLVVPGPVHETYRFSQRSKLWSLARFTELVKDRQRLANR